MMKSTKYKICLFLIAIIMFFPPARPAVGKIVTDSLGRRVKVPERVDRIGALYAFTAHAVAMLGKADRIVAVSNGPKRDILLNQMYPWIKDAVVPKYQGAINIEELARAKPDIVFVGLETGLNDAEARKLDTFGIPWLTVSFKSMDQQIAAILMIGAAIGSNAKALRYETYYRKCLNKVKKKVLRVPETKRIRVYLATNEPTRTALPDSLPSDWLKAAGAWNVAARSASNMIGKNQLSIEQIILWNPQVILANEPGAALLIASSSKWSEIEGVKNRKVFQMPIGISRWGHPGSLETPLAILWTAKTLYPEFFEDIDIQKELRYFYKTFFNYDLSEKLVRHVLSGRGMRLTKNKKKVQ